MKKLISIMLCLVLVAAIGVGCSKGGTEEPTVNPDEPAIVGGWQRAESPEITDDFRAVFDKAIAELDGAEYTPVAYVASQVVAGTNHCVLCKAMDVMHDDNPTVYILMYIYEDLQGNAEVTSVYHSSVTCPSYDEPVSGGWGETASPVVTEEARAALEKACKPLDVNPLAPIAYLQMQVVAGFNYLLLCENPNVAEGDFPYQLVTVYAGLDGNAQITETADFTAE